MLSAAKKVKQAGDRSAEALPRLAAVTDHMHACVMQRTDALARCADDPPAQAELVGTASIIASYARQRWPEEKILDRRR